MVGLAARPTIDLPLISAVGRRQRAELACCEGILEKGNPQADIKLYTASEEVPLYNPIAEYLNSMPEWDGHNHEAGHYDEKFRIREGASRQFCLLYGNTAGNRLMVGLW